MNGDQVTTENIVTAWYDKVRRHWRWECSLCEEEHGTTAIDPDHDGPVQTAVRNHIDATHPDDDVIIEIKNADGDTDDTDDDD